MARILIKDGYVWDGERFFYADILTDGATVAEIGTGISAPADFVYDAKGKTVLPGLVDAHIHIRGISYDRYGTGADLCCLPFGVTAAADAGGGQGDEAVLNSLTLKTTVFVGVSIKQNRADFSKIEERLAAYGEKAIGLKVYFDTVVSEVSDITPLCEVCELARKKGLRVMVHSSHSPTPMSEILETLRAGDILTHAFHGGENNAAEDGFASMKQAQSKGVVIDVGFAGHVHTDFAILRQAIGAGVIPDVISTDVTKLSTYTRGGRYGMTECINIATLLGMKQEHVFRAVTSHPATALGKAEEWGYLKVGRCADLAVLAYTDEGFDLTDRAGNRIKSQRGYRCVLTVADGRVVYQD